MMKNAAFQLRAFSFPKALLDFEKMEPGALDVQFLPQGAYNECDGSYHLTFNTKVLSQGSETAVAEIICRAEFSFLSPMPLSEIPDFFYPNSIAILFPYIRAFVSTLSLQANCKPIILPTINLSGLKDQLKQNTTTV